MMTQTEVEDLIIELLAVEAGRDPVELRHDLEKKGDQLPIDSILAAEVLAAVEERCDVPPLPATAENAKHLKSVSTFAAAILDLMASVATKTARSA